MELTLTEAQLVVRALRVESDRALAEGRNETAKEQLMVAIKIGVEKLSFFTLERLRAALTRIPQ